MRTCKLILLGLALLASGCAKPAGVLFETADTLIVWPPEPDIPRVRYVGQLRSAADLHPSRTAIQELGRAIFGASDPEGVLISPIGICTNGGDKAYIADRAAGLIHVYDLETREYDAWRPSLGPLERFEPVAVEFDPIARRVFAADPAAGLVHVFEESGAYLGSLGDNELRRPVGLAFDAERELLYVADSGDHRVAVLTMQDTLEASIGSRGYGDGQFNFPTFLAFGPDGRLYVSDSLNCRVQVFSRSGDFERSIGSRGDMPGYFSQPKGVDLDSEGHLFVVDSNFEAVQLFNRQGAVLMTFGQEGHGPGEFWLPVDLQIDKGGRVWVADSYNRRIQVFELIPPEAGLIPSDSGVEETDR